MNIKNYWAGFVGEINTAISEKDCKKFSVVYAVIAIFMAIAGKKNKWYLLGAAVYGILSGALFQSYKKQKIERLNAGERKRKNSKKKFDLNEPVEK